MFVEPAKLDAVLAAAVGNDPALLAELRRAFFTGARAHIDALARAGGDAERQAAAWRLHGLAASFGAIALMERAAEAGAGRGADPMLLRQMTAALDALAG